MSHKSTGETQQPVLERWERSIGGHFLHFEPPDIIIARLVGDVGDPHVAPLLKEIIDRAREQPHAYLLMDMSRMGTITPAGRKTAAANRVPPNTLVAIFGATFTQRVIVKFVLKIARVFSGKPSVTHMFDTEAAARAWIEEQRRARQHGA